MPPELNEYDPNLLAQHPWLIWVVVAVFFSTAAVVVSEKLQKALGPLGRFISTRQARGIARKSNEMIAWNKFNSVVKAALAEEVAGLKSMLDAERDARAADRLRHSEEIRGLREQLEVALLEIRRLSTLVDGNRDH